MPDPDRVLAALMVGPLQRLIEAVNATFRRPIERAISIKSELRVPGASLWQAALPMPIRLLLALLPLAISAPALAAAPEQWEAVSETAMAITGNVKFLPDRITFRNGKSLPLARAGDIQAFGTPRETVSATLYRVRNPGDPVLLNGNRLCGGKGRQRVTFIAVWRPTPVGSDIDPRGMAAFSGSARPTAAGGSDFCGTYYYEAGHH